MSREDATPYDGPCCRWCGRDVEEDDQLCARCREERDEARAEEAFLGRREGLALERRRAARELVGTEAAS